MSTSQTESAGPPVRRVRHQLRDGVAVMACSLGASVSVALLLALLLGGR